MDISTTEKLKIIAKRKGIAMKDLAEKSNQTIQNLCNKFKLGNMRESDVQTLANLLDCDVRITLIDRKTGEVF